MAFSVCLVGGLRNGALDYTASGMVGEFLDFLLEWVRYTCLGNKRVILYLFRCKVNVWSELLRLIRSGPYLIPTNNNQVALSMVRSASVHGLASAPEGPLAPARRV